MPRLVSRWLLSFCAPACLGLAACSGGAAPHGRLNEAALAPQAAPGAAVLPLPAPSTLLKPGAAPRRVAFTENDVLQDGADYDLTLPHNLDAKSGSEAELSPAWTGNQSGAAGLAYCTYHFNVPGYDRNAQVKLSFSTPPADPAGSSWIALAHWEADRWDWYAGSASGVIDLPFIAPYFGPADDLLLVVLRTGEDQSRHERVRLGGEPPSAAIIATPDQGVPPLAVQLDASGSEDFDGGIVHYEWDVDGDGTFETDGGATPTLDTIYNANGVILPAVRVTDSQGISAESMAQVIVLSGWQHSYGRASLDQVEDIAVDQSGAVYTVGRVQEPEMGGTFSLQLTRLDLTGAVVWARSWDSPADDYGHTLALDADGNLVVAGQTSTGNTDCILQKWSPDGTLLWSKTFGGGNADTAVSIAVDGSEIYLGGSTSSASPSSDFLALRLDSAGTIGWARARNYGELDSGRDLALKWNSLVGVYGVCVLGNRNLAGKPNVWKVEWDEEGAFYSGLEFDNPAVSKSGESLIFYQQPPANAVQYYIGGTVEVGGIDHAFFVSMPVSGAAHFGERWGSSFDARIDDIAYDSNLNYVVSGWYSGGLNTQGLALTFARFSGDVLDAQLVGDAVAEVKLSCSEPYQGYQFFGGLAPSAAPAWADAGGSSADYTATWVAADGTGTDLNWTTSDLAGTVTDITLDLILDTGAGDDEALLALREGL